MTVPITPVMCVFEHLQRGEFVVQRQQTYGFSQIACDQTIEQTANRDSKTKGGLTGITLNKGAVHRWILSQPARAKVSERCSEMAGKLDATRPRKDLDDGRIRKDDKDVASLLSTLESMTNPFSYLYDSLVNISTGVVADENIASDIDRAEQVGEAALKIQGHDCLCLTWTKMSLHFG